MSSMLLGTTSGLFRIIDQLGKGIAHVLHHLVLEESGQLRRSLGSA